MRDRNNPLKHIPPQVFTILQAFREDFIKDLSDVPTRYPTGKITSLSQYNTVPLLMVKEEYQDRVEYRTARSIEDLINEVEVSDTPIIFIQYTPTWFETDDNESITRFINLCRDRAKKNGPVVMLAVMFVDIPQPLKDGAGHFTRILPIRNRGKRLAMKEQTNIDTIHITSSGPVPGTGMYGQAKLGEW